MWKNVEKKIGRGGYWMNVERKRNGVSKKLTPKCFTRSDYIQKPNTTPNNTFACPSSSPGSV